MAGRGGFTAITPELMRRLLAIRYKSDLDDDECDDAIMQEVADIEKKISYNSADYCDVNKAWDPIHRALTGDQTPEGRLTPLTGRGPLKFCVLGEDQLIEADYHNVGLIRPAQVRKIAVALAKINKEGFHKRFFKLDPEVVCDYSIDEDEFEYTWSNFSGLPRFFRRAADNGRAVLFIADT
jgi:hypothetical protein